MTYPEPVVRVRTELIANKELAKEIAAIVRTEIQAYKELDKNFLGAVERLRRVSLRLRNARSGYEKSIFVSADELLALIEDVEDQIRSYFIDLHRNALLPAEIAGEVERGEI